jgi:hypothetical protein
MCRLVDLLQEHNLASLGMYSVAQHFHSSQSPEATSKTATLLPQVISGNNNPNTQESRMIKWYIYTMEYCTTFLNSELNLHVSAWLKLRK